MVHMDSICIEDILSNHIAQPEILPLQSGVVQRSSVQCVGSECTEYTCTFTTNTVLHCKQYLMPADSGRCSTNSRHSIGHRLLFDIILEYTQNYINQLYTVYRLAYILVKVTVINFYIHCYICNIIIQHLSQHTRFFFIMSAVLYISIQIIKLTNKQCHGV